MEREFESSFFATIFTIVHPSKKPLSVIIQNQYQNLTDLTKKAFQYICCFHQFNLAINIELLVRSLRITYDNFYNDVIALYNESIVCYRLHKWQESIKHLEKALSINKDDALCRIYLERCQYFLENPPDSTWDGVWTMKDK